MTLHLFSDNFSSILECNFVWQAQYLVRLEMPVAPRIVNDVSYVTGINHESHFAWQVQYLRRWRMRLVPPRIVNDVSYATDINLESHFA